MDAQSPTAESRRPTPPAPIPRQSAAKAGSDKTTSATSNLKITDAQIHTWRTGKPSAHQRQLPFPPELLLEEMKQAGVSAAVVVPPSWDPHDNAPANTMAAQHPDKIRVMGRLELDKPEARNVFANLSVTPYMLGFRVMFTTPERRAWLENGNADWLWHEAEKAKVPLMVHVPHNLHTIKDVAQRHSGLRLVIDHLGIPPNHPGSNASMAHIPELAELAKLPNVAVKATGVPGYSAEAYPYRNLHEPMHRAFDAFGPSRMFWGSDLTRMNCSYRQCITLFTEELPWLSESDKKLVMGEGVRNWLGWR
jgi:predicted TIM-barrel fold metal-dependent hydrolase